MTAATTTKRPYRMDVRARRSKATAERILGEALEQFLSRSYDEVTLAGIAREAGVTVPTLIAHFGRKEDLFIAACEAWGYRMIERGKRAPVDDHAAAVHYLFEQYEGEGEFILHLLAEEGRFPSVREITERGRVYHRLWVERTFEPSLRPLQSARKEQLMTQLVVVTDVLSWKQLRLDMKLSRRKAEATVVQMIDALTGGS